MRYPRFDHLRRNFNLHLGRASRLFRGDARFLAHWCLLRQVYSCRFRAQIQSFQSHAADFPGDRRLPGRRSVLLPVHGEKVRMRGRAGADSGRSPRPLTPTLSPLKRGEGVLRLPSPLVSGRGFNLFRALRRISRAIGSQPRGWRSRGARALDASPDRYLPGQSLRVAHDGVAPTISCSRWNFASRAARASVDGSHRAA